MSKYIFFFSAIVLVLLTGLFAPIGSILAAAAPETASPQKVVLVGTHQDELGCSGEWQPDCDKTLLVYDAEDDIWQAIFEIQPANDNDKKGPRYKVAMNGSWTENYGLHASSGGPDIPLIVTEKTLVKFYYDNTTHWITDNYNTPILVAMGDFQKQLGCNNNNDSGCLRSWLQDPDGDGTYSFTTIALTSGTYTTSLAQNEDPANIIAPEQTFTVSADGDEIYFGFNTETNKLIISTGGAPKGSLSSQNAVWVNADTLVWKVPASPQYSYSFYYSPDGTLELTSDGITNGIEIPLTFQTSKLSEEILTKFPYLNRLPSFRITSPDHMQLRDVLKGQIAIQVRDIKGKVIDVTGVQIPGALDALYTYDGPLGVVFDGNVPTLRVWAPTAFSVNLKLFADSETNTAKTIPMAWDSSTGVWTLTGSSDWYGQFYLYEVHVFVPSSGKFETNLVTDPYSFSLSTNSKRSQVIDLNDPNLKPSSWDKLDKPVLVAPEDIVIYELHVRDFSIFDLTVPEKFRGLYLAFTQTNSDGMQHLRSLAEAGLTHIHLLPAFDIASVNEDKSTWKTVDEAALAKLAPDSNEQFAAVSAIISSDGFNWGYDPIHYTVPDGAYATDPNGTARILEFRQMVQALNKVDLRVVMDVVYNHTNSSGQNANSVLDKIVPGYYYRLDETGRVTTSTCCQNTATEHTMMRKLMVDSLVTWSTQYKVDGFRFDLMGHHMLADMQAVRAALDALTLEKDGMDGKSIYIYGEGWDFGEMAKNARGVNASQLNIGGTGIGVFNDRLRDAVRGGSPFDDPRVQGFATGLYLSPNTNESRSADAQHVKLLEYIDWTRLGLAGNLTDYEIVDLRGNTMPGSQVLYNGAPAAYTADPQENIVYVSAHDNETLFDAIQVKAPAEASIAERVRMNNLALSIPMFSQGIPFFHAGDDILRSKSLDRNSYNSGDWFNKLDWTYTSNNWGVGLPIEGSSYYDIFQPLLADPGLVPAPSDIKFAGSVFNEMIRIRKSSPLFRLQTADEVKSDLTFLNTGPDQIPGLIVMRLSDKGSIDPVFSEIVVLFNANPDEVTFSDSSLLDKYYTLHPVQQKSVDPVVRTSYYETVNGSFTIPSYTTTVFVIKEKTEPNLPLLIGAAIVAFAGVIAVIFIRKRN
jgi:pullulanase-type alpha-1,6-glucosidase